jgi:PPOX class probable F420-dependent enzyme
MRRRVLEARVGRLATLGAHGDPHVVPLCFALDGETLYSAIDQKPKRSQRLRRVENLRANPQAAVLVDHYEERWSRLWWVRVDAEARMLEEGTERERALELLVAKYRQYQEAPPNGPVIALDVRRWTGWSAAGTGS